MRTARWAMDLRGEVEVVDRRQQKPRLAHDLLCTLAVAAVRRPQILALDDLREADDRIQGSLDLVDQLAKRVRVGERLRGFLRDLRLFLLAQSDAAIAAEAPVRRIERRHPADLPFAGNEPVASDVQGGVTER